MEERNTNNSVITQKPPDVNTTYTSSHTSQNMLSTNNKLLLLRVTLTTKLNINLHEYVCSVRVEVMTSS